MQVNLTLIDLHRTWSPLDYAFYDYFKDRMNHTISNQEGDFQGEVKLFEEYLKKTATFCDNICSQRRQLKKSNVSAASLLASLAQVL